MTLGAQSLPISFRLGATVGELDDVIQLYRCTHSAVPLTLDAQGIAREVSGADTLQSRSANPRRALQRADPA